MEARNRYENEVEVLPQIEEKPLVQEYVPVRPSQKARRKRERKEASFFLHVSTYSLLFFLCYPIFQSFLPFILTFPIALFLPIGIILGSKKLFWKYFINKKPKQR